MAQRFMQYAAVALVALSATQAMAAPGSVQLEKLTSPELGELIGQGYDTVIVPTGGTEQNGPHLELGKHNDIVAYTSQAIARKLGHTLVAPVIGYVPEGNITPPQGHMRFAGTLSVREQTFAALLEDTARSLKQHGFKRICFISDHGGSIAPQEEVASRLGKEWEAEGVSVLAVNDYYAANGQEKWVAGLNKGIVEPNAHAGFADTSELMVANPEGVRTVKIQPFKPSDEAATGVKGDPSQASAEYGRALLEMKVDAAVHQIGAKAKPEGKH